MANRLFDGLKQGDARAIETIYETLLPKIKSWIMSKGGIEDDAHDVFQETLETIILKVDHVHSSFDGLVIQIAKYKWIDRLRKSKKEVRNASSIRLYQEESFEEQFIQREQDYLKFKLMDKTFKQLSTLCQELIQLIKQELDVKSIVQKMNFSSANTLYRRKSACMERWSSLVKSDVDYPNTMS